MVNYIYKVHKHNMRISSYIRPILGQIKYIEEKYAICWSIFMELAKWKIKRQLVYFHIFYVIKEISAVILHVQ